MIPLDVFGSESVAADLLEQVRWRDGVTCPRCRSDRTVRNGSYREFQRYLCKNCDRTFNDKTGTIFAHSKIALRRWLFSIYAFLRFNTSLRQLQCEIEVTHKTLHRRIERFARALDGLPSISSARSKSTKCTSLPGRKAASATGESRSRGLSTRGRGSYSSDKPPIFIIADRGTEQRYVIPAKAADESTIQLLLADRQQESLTVYTDGFRAYEPLEDDNAFDREYIVHSDGEYADDEVHVNACESHASRVRRWLSPHRGISKNKLTLPQSVTVSETRPPQTR
ncbi:IS1595 family transposase [Haloarcula rubripromontorii]|uniref:IS1595 family transposase n=1 Tax=Haloarcula rubripromontorii TaxID=1705562 RepID=UPI00345C2C48